MIRFRPAMLTGAEEALRAEVREFLATHLPWGTYRPNLGMVTTHAPAFSAALAERGWVGMALPARYGGHDRTNVERFVVIEELLAAGAPVSAHWIADRQVGPAILRYGTEEQRQRFLPEIAAGRCWFSIGMSEPDSGSDLAAVRTSAARVDGGWLVNGTKLWTSGAHVNHYALVLCRTGAPGGDRHEGLSQLVVDLGGRGVAIRTITSLDSSRHFNEVVLQDVFVPDQMLLGELGAGWQQVTAELAHERAGPDRYLSTLPLLRVYFDELRPDLTRADLAEVARLIAMYRGVREMSLSVARQLDEGRVPAIEAALVKDLGTALEQEVVEVIRRLARTQASPDAESMFGQLLAQAIMSAPTFTLRGGTSEILRMIVARQLVAP